MALCYIALVFVSVHKIYKVPPPDLFPEEPTWGRLCKLVAV